MSPTPHRTPTPASTRRNAVTSTYTALLRDIRQAGLLHRTHQYYVWVLSGIVTALAATVAGFILLGHSWFQLLIAAALGVILTQFSFLAHEAAHRQILDSGPRNDRLGRILANGVVGISYLWWMAKHTRHHANPNQVDKDPDIALGTLVFVPEQASHHRGLMALLTRHQGWLFFPLLTLEGINLHVTSIRTLITNDRTALRTRMMELLVIGLRITCYLAIIFWVLPIGLGFAFLGVQLAVFGVYMGASFAPNHKGMTILPASSTLDFFTKQVVTSRNIRGGWWANLAMGGLNYQIEHHLFPSMPRPHLRRASVIVQEHCTALGLPYTQTSLLAAYGIVVRYLNQVGLGARDPFDCPMFHQLRRQ